VEKIREIIQINSGYTSYVDLYEDYYDIAKNRGRMERYKPIAAHRKVFADISNALNPRDRRFYFLSGSYGTGKSHLLLMLGNYFASSSDVEELETFFSNYEIAQSEVLLKPGETLDERTAASLKDARKSGRYLVALCRYSLNLDFEGALLRALEEAMENDDTSILLDSHYSEALRRLDKWDAQRTETRFYSDFEASLTSSNPDWTISDIREGLQTYDDQALIVFKQCFSNVTDSEFTYKKDNLRDIITDFLKNTEFKERYEGIVFLYDEFGSCIDKGLVGYRTLLDFSQYCANSTLEKGGTVVFIGSGHKAFLSHGNLGDYNAETLGARVTEIGLQTQGMEDIIAAIVQPKKDHPLWDSEVKENSHKFTWYSNESKRLNLFNWLPAPKIKNNVIENIYPMHPLATFALLRLAKEAGSDNRSVFKFFAPEFEDGSEGWKNVLPYSYPWFIEKNAIIKNDSLVMYTADLLVDHFEDGLKATNSKLGESIKKSVGNYEATIRELNAYLAKESESQLFDSIDDLTLRIIKAMLINEIISTPDIAIANTSENILFALDAISADEKKQVTDRLKMLSDPKVGVIYNNQGVYELIPGDRVDVQRIVEQYRANPDNRPSQILKSFLEFNPIRGIDNYIEAKDYNSNHGEDKRLKVTFEKPTSLAEEFAADGNPIGFFEKLEADRRSQGIGVNGYEGNAVFVFCENEREIDTAKKALSKNSLDRVVIAIPKTPIIVFDAVFTLKALDSQMFKKQAETFSPLERSQEKEIRDDAMLVLKKARQSYLNNSKVNWFGKNGVEISVQENKSFDVANKVMEGLFGNARNSFSHTEFNKSHMKLSSQKVAVFKEAGNILCDTSQNIRVNWAWPDNRGGTKYLRKCFVDQQVLRILETEGDARILEPEKDTSKFKLAMPSYAQLIEDLAELEGKGPVNLNKFIETYSENFGQGEIAITLMLLLSRRFYGDSLRFKKEPGNLIDIQFADYKEMLDIVQGKSPSAVVLFEPVSKENQAYFAKIAQLFTNEPAPAGKVYSISEAYIALTTWWDRLPVISRSLEFYTEEYRPYAELMSQAKTKDPFNFINKELLEILSIEPGEILDKIKLMSLGIRLKAFKANGDAIESRVNAQILEGIAEIFEASSELDVDIQDALRDWYNGLSNTQKDAMGSYHNNDSRPLVKYNSYANIKELLYAQLPQAYSLGIINAWITNYVPRYLEHVRKGKAHIETNAPDISQLVLKYDSPVKEKGKKVSYQGELVLSAETDDGKGEIYYTTDGSNPAVSSTNRKKVSARDSLNITGNTKLKFVVADGQGNYSAVTEIQAIDELAKYSIKRPEQVNMDDEAITFIFPKDKDAVEQTISSLISAISKAEILSSKKLNRLILDILEKLD
jgi:hypothetical protein